MMTVNSLVIPLTLLTLLLLMVSIKAPSCSGSLASAPTSSACPEPSIPEVTLSACSEPMSPAPAGYGMVRGFRVLILKPADGWICRCLLLSGPMCSCALAPITENGSKTTHQIPIYFDATIRSHYPEHMLGF